MKSIFDPSYIRLISHLREQRRGLGMTQAAVCERLGLSRSWLGKVESRERRLDVLELHRLCALYEIPWADVEPLLEKKGSCHGKEAR